MFKVGKTPKLAVATPKVTITQGSTLGSDDKLAQFILKTDKDKEKAVEPKPNKGKNNDRDILIRGVFKFQVENTVLLSKSAKVVLLSKFKKDFLKLKEFITKLKIYILHNYKSFNNKDSKVLFAILYLEGLVFEFI